VGTKLWAQKRGYRTWV
jgi:hypothetical protein